MYRNKHTKKFPYKKLLLAAVLLACVGAGVIWAMNRKEPATPNNTDNLTTSTEPSAQSDFTGGDKREPGNGMREDEGSASVKDNDGSIDDTDIDKSNPLVSSTGEITVFSPAQDSTVQNKIQIAGSSTLDQVSYRVVDSISGVIASGVLSVVDGKFSGSLTVATGASEGRLDLFGVKDNGNEYSNLAIPLRFAE